MKKNENLYNNSDFIEDYIKDNNEKFTFRYKLYLSKLLNTVNALMVDNMLLNNVPINIGGAFDIKMYRVIRNFDSLAINWGESNRIKKEILDRGGKPAKKIGVTPSGNPVYDDGELWMVFYIDDDYIFIDRKFKYYQKDNVPTLIHRNTYYWKFEPARRTTAKMHKLEKSGIIKRLDIPLQYGNKNNFI